MVFGCCCRAAVLAVGGRRGDLGDAARLQVAPHRPHASRATTTSSSRAAALLLLLVALLGGGEGLGSVLPLVVWGGRGGQRHAAGVRGHEQGQPRHQRPLPAESGEAGRWRRRGGSRGGGRPAHRSGPGEGHHLPATTDGRGQRCGQDTERQAAARGCLPGPAPGRASRTCCLLESALAGPLLPSLHPR